MMQDNEILDEEKERTIKLQKVYIPFLLTAFGTGLLYNLWRWAVEIGFLDVLIKKEHLDFLFPTLFSFLTTLLFLRKRITLLEIQGRRGDRSAFGLFILMIVAIALPVVVSQNYIERASFNLISVNNILDIENYSNEKYFEITSFNVDKTDIAWHVDITSANRNNNKITLFTACKFIHANRVWYGWQYNEILKKTVRKKKQQENYHNFLNTAQQQFEAQDIQHVRYFEKLSYSDYRDNFIQAITSKFYNLNGEHQIILVPHFQAFENRLGNYIFWSLCSFSVMAVLVLFIVNKSQINKEKLLKFEQSKPSLIDNIRDLPNNIEAYFHKITTIPTNIAQYLDPNGSNKNIAILLLVNIIVVLFIAVTVLIVW